MKKSRKEFILEAHDNACNDWRNRIEKEFPKLFAKTELEVGKWYRDTTDKYAVIFNSGNIKEGNYGIGREGLWVERYNIPNTNISKYRLATDKEVEEALIKEAKKRGFKKGVKFECAEYCLDVFDGVFRYNKYEKTTLDGWNVGNIFKNGVWAKPVETITKEEAEKELGKTIID